MYGSPFAVKGATCLNAAMGIQTYICVCVGGGAAQTPAHGKGGGGAQGFRSHDPRQCPTPWGLARV